MLRTCQAVYHALVCIANVVKRAVLLSPILLVFAIILGDWVTFLFVFMARRYDQSPIQAIVFTIAFTAAAVVAVTSYLRCVFVSNSPEDNPIPQHIDLADCHRCAKCSALKPDRAHHCSMCGKCCLKMDHHCPWIANCVGHYNYKYFILFVFWCCIGCFIYIAGVRADIFSVFHVASSKHLTLEIMALFSVVSSIAFGLTLFGFTAFHLHLVLLNQTTLEYGFIRPNLNPYDQGRRKNFESIFGNRMLYWLLPVDTLQVSGWEYILSSEESMPISHRSVFKDSTISLV